MPAMTDEIVQIVGGHYVGCQVRIGPGEWREAACKKPFEAMVAVGDDLAVVVCEEHLRLFERRSATVV